MESLANVGLVVGLAGLAVIVLYLIFRQILSMEIFPRLNAIVTGEIIKNIIDGVFRLALVAMILGFLGFALINVLPVFQGTGEGTEPHITSFEPVPEEVTRRARLIVNTPTPIPATAKDLNNAPTLEKSDTAAEPFGTEEAEAKDSTSRVTEEIENRSTLIESSSVDPFLIDRSEVTNEQYRACVTSKGCEPPKNDRWEDDQLANYPVTDVNWNQATAYCDWLGGKLPTVEHWTAAISPDGTRYPWGNEHPLWGAKNKDPSCKLAILRYCYDEKVSQVFPVGSRPDGNNPPGVKIESGGIADLIGNVWEWLDTEPPGQPERRLVAGGSWSNPAGEPVNESEILTFTQPNLPFQGLGRQTNNLGFRCVWSPE